MKKSERFLGLIDPLIREKLGKLDLMELEKTVVLTYVYNIFRRHKRIEPAYEELREYMQKSSSLYDLIPEIRKIYNQIDK